MLQNHQQQTVNGGIKMITNDKDNQDIIVYNTKDIQEIFKCGRKMSYEIMNMKGFPSFRINSMLLVEKKALIAWLERNKGKNLIS